LQYIRGPEVIGSICVPLITFIGNVRAKRHEADKAVLL